MKRKYKKHVSGCYPKRFTWDDVPAAFYRQFDFAEEFNTVDSFCELYKTLPKHLTDEIVLSERKCRAHCEICERCKTGTPQHYDGCKLLAHGYDEEKVVSMVLKDDPDQVPPVCPECGNKLGPPPYRKRSSVLHIRDIRLLGKPTAIEIKRERVMCHKKFCGRLIGQQRITGMQFYEAGDMTIRLAASVLTCHLYRIGRRYIAEAYALSASQVDRIYNRFRQFQQDEKNRADLDFMIRECERIETDVLKIYTDAFETQSPVELFFDKTVAPSGVSSGSNGGAAYMNYCLVGGVGSGFADAYENLKESGGAVEDDKYMTRLAFMAGGVRHYNAKYRIKGQRLKDCAAALGMLYYDRFESGSRYYGFRLDDETEAMIDELAEKLRQGKGVRRILTKLEKAIREHETNELASNLQFFIESDLYKRLRPVDVKDDDDSWEDQRSDKTVRSAQKKALKRLEAKVTAFAEKSGYSEQELLDYLLYFNPAAVSAEAFDLFTTEDGNAKLERHRMGEPFGCYRSDDYGTPIHCLEHILQSCLEDENAAVHCHIPSPGDTDTGAYCPMYPLLCPRYDASRPINLRRE